MENQDDFLHSRKEMFRPVLVAGIPREMGTGLPSSLLNIEKGKQMKFTNAIF